MAEVSALLDRAVSLPPGPELAAVLAQLPAEEVPNVRLIDLARARTRQLAHDQAEQFTVLVAISHASTTDLGDDTVARQTTPVESAPHEIAAGLTWIPTTADRELHLATALVERLPLVQEALRRGEIDRWKARVFADHLDPGNGDITPAHAEQLCAHFLPLAPGLTTKQLSRRLLRALHAIDPQARRRRYERALRTRSVSLYLNPSTGTATLVGEGLAPHEAAAAAARLDRLVETAKQAGHPGRRPQIAADLYLGMLNGDFAGLTEHQIITRLLLGSPEPVTAREGIEVRLGLATAAGLDDRAGEIPGLGPIGADVARAAVLGQQRGAGWRFAILDTAGHLRLAGTLLRRPQGAKPPAVRGGFVELHLTEDELRRYATDPAMSAWAGVVAEIAAAWAARERLLNELSARPDARFARGPLAEHVRIRDRFCIAPGCTHPARASDLDHTIDFGRGGRTTDANLGPLCRRHHPDKDRGWRLSQPEPGLFIWISPLGQTYQTRGEPEEPEPP